MQQQGCLLSRVLEALHDPPGPAPMNSNELFIAQQKKNAAPLPLPSLSMCATRAGSLRSPSCPAGEPALFPGKGNSGDYYTHYPTAPRLLKKTRVSFVPEIKGDTLIRTMQVGEH